MKWIKASERLPDDDSIKYLRHKMGVGDDFYLKDIGYYRKGKHLFYSNQGSQMWTVSENLEWLEENSPSLSNLTQEIDKDASGNNYADEMIEILKNVAYCTGCGHKASEPLGTNKIGVPYSKCCPDNDYVVKLSFVINILNQGENPERSVASKATSIDELLYQNINWQGLEDAFYDHTLNHMSYPEILSWLKSNMPKFIK